MPKNGRIIEKKMADEEIETNSNESRLQSSFGGGIVNSTSETENRSVKKRYFNVIAISKTLFVLR